jgi:Na+/proline symporter
LSALPPSLILAVITVYFAALLYIAWYTARRANADGYFLGNRNSPWWVVMLGLIGDSLSGVTFVSVPGAVAGTQFSYLQVVLGYTVGYWIISFVLLPLYYRTNLTSIYQYLGERFGPQAQRTGSAFFLLSRVTGAAARLYLAAGVLHAFVFAAWGIPFLAVVVIVLALILLYTLKGGIKTLVWTDLYQSMFLLGGVSLSIAALLGALGLGPWELWGTVAASEHSRVFFWDGWRADQFFWKQFVGGILIATAMTGLDQNMMQKNLSCRSLGGAQKNLMLISVVVIIVNGMFLVLGALLYHFADTRGIALPTQSDLVFPVLALEHLGLFAAVVFIMGLTAATFNSADSVLTTLTTSFYFDILGRPDHEHLDDRSGTRTRRLVHVAFAFVLLLTILVFQAVNSGAVITTVLVMANYTYGPLLGLFFFGLCTRRSVRGAAVPALCIAAPVACWVLSANSAAWFDGYRFGYELLAVNALFTAAGLWGAGVGIQRSRQETGDRRQEVPSSAFGNGDGRFTAGR